MDIRQLREWGKRLFDSVGANTKKAIAGVISAAMIVTVALVTIPAQAAGNMVADPTTFTQWEQGVGNPTDPRSTGRVWTDKSVSTEDVKLTTYLGDKVTVTPKQDSFLVGLSALSSAQKLIGVSNVAKPLDIVLVLDTSGSMRYGMDGNQNPGYSYQPVYVDQLDTSRTYYIPNGNNYREVRWSNNPRGWGYGSGNRWTSVTPKTSANDADENHVQFYTRATASRMNALKQAVNGFIDQTIAANEKVSDANKMNRIGLVTYASSANIRSGLTDSLIGLKTTVGDLTANGATRADLGMQQALSVLGNARADASKIVIFFTDGQPTSSNTFDPTVANSAIASAKTMKNGDASVYSIGIFEGADPAANVSAVTDDSNTTLKSNAFMQGVSSNYPDATAYTALGARAPDSNYYLAASDVDALNGVFDTIWDEVSSNPTSPIQSESTTGTTVGKGAVTFTDQLGDYMTVKSMNSVIFAGQKFTFDPEAENAVVTDGTVTTYMFHGEVAGNEVYKVANLQDLKITVTNNGEKTGDTVKVEVPADLLPLRLYTATVDKDGNVTTDIARTHPIRLFYDVALKDGVDAKVVKPDAEMSEYIAKHTVDGNVQFLTNAYDTSTKPENGTTTAVFTPATTNDFYYFTQDTPLYNSENLNDPAKSIENSTTEKYYYQRTYYANNAKHEQWIEVLGSNAYGKAVADNEGNYYAPAGTTRTGLSRRYTAVKDENPTDTATNAIAPHWEMNTVTVNLGNNGLQTMQIPGALTITEHVVWPEGAAKNPDKQFPFTLSLTDSDDKPLAGEYEATLNGQSIKVGNGYKFNLKDGETISIYGLPDGAKASNVQTNAGGNGWSVNEATQNRDIEANTTKSMEFVNTYALTPTTLAAGSIKGSKTLTGRDWQQDESFTFQIAAGGANPDAPMPNPATVTVKNPNTGEYRDGQKINFSFGEIKYTTPGTYQYVITEQGGSKPGMNYSGARYVVTVMVADNGDGTIAATPVMTNMFNDGGEHIDGEPEVNAADFVNRFLGGNEAVATIRGWKDYTDHTGSNPNNAVGKFNVDITADGNNPANGPTFPGTVPVGLDGTWARDLVFTNAALNGQGEQTFTYHVREQVPAGVDAAHPTKDGMTYDVNTYEVQIVVSRDTDQNLIATVTYPNGADRVELTNSYRAADTDAQPLQVTKTVTGRDAEADRFSFNATLSAGDAKHVKVRQPDGTLNDWSDVSASVPEIEKGASKDIDLGSLVFTMPGDYTFAVREQLPEGASVVNPKVGGWTYDTHEYTVAYAVTDDNGKLTATATADGSATFTNAYTASVNYGTDGTMRIGKTLTGHSMNPQEFSFAITPVNGAPMPNGAQSVTTTNPFSAVSGQELIWPETGTLLADLQFTQDNAGRIYTYTIREVPPEGVDADHPTKDGVTYDLQSHTATIEVIDNGDGTMRTVTKVDGEENTPARFANTYAIADGHSEIGFAKTITGRDWKDGESFTFDLTPNTEQSSVAENVLEAAMPQNTSVTVGKPGDGNTGPFAFTGFTFRQPGTYVYNVTERNAGKTTDGLTHDGRTAVASFTVVDNGRGEYSIGRLITGVDSVNGMNTFTNSYKAKPFIGVPTDMEFSKTLAGTEWADREFTFTLMGEGDAPMPDKTTVTVGKPDNGSDTVGFKFDPITYDKAGTYRYQVAERNDGQGGITYDDHTSTVTVEVTDNGRGQLVAAATVENGQFKNTYATQPSEGVPAGMAFSKRLTGIAWPENREFEFTLEGADGAPMPAEAKVSVGKPEQGDTASFDFGAIRYENPGVYEYTVKETHGDMPGVAYDGHTAKVSVTVTDNGTGNLQAEAEVSESQFVNKYSAQPATGVPTDFTLHKRVDGMAWNEDQRFEFTIQGQEGAPMPKNGTVTVGKPAEGDTASFDFGEIVFERAGVYRYTVNETAGSQPGMAYDGHAATITVDVADDGQGHLVTATTVENGLFTNKYTTQTVAYPGVTVTEDLTGRAQAQGEFQFVVRGSDEDMRRAGYTPQARAVSGAHEFDAAASGETVTVPGVFTGLELTHDDIRSGRKFNYEVDQIGAQSGNGLTVDEQVYAVQIWATDNGDGTMRVHTSVNGTETSEKTPVLPFHNVYATAPVTIGGDTQVRINAHKTLHGRDLNDGEFHFAVRDAKDAQLAGGTNAADGTVRFDAIEFTDARLAEDVKAGVATAHIDGTRTVYRYAATVSEITDSLPSGVTALESGFAVTLVITDNGDGQLQAKVEYPADANGTLNFVNQYGAASEVSLGMNGNKVLAMASGDNAPDITGKYTFTLSGSEGAPMPEKTQVTNDASGAVDFGEIKFTVANVFGESAAEKPAGESAGEFAGESAQSEDSTETEGTRDAEETGTNAGADAVAGDEPAKREKTLTYTVSESGTVAGVTNDATAQRTIDVHVVDNGDGTLTVSRQSDVAGTAFTFTNTYGVQPVGPVSPTDLNVAGSVPLTKTLSGRDLRAGEFTFELIEASGEGRVIGTAVNAADGTVSLPGVMFDKPGNYAYLVREVAGNAGGVSYDRRTYAAVAQVTDAGDGTLAVTWQITDATGAAVQSMAFTNEYAAEPTSAQFSVGKMLDGRDLVANEFSFALRGADGDTPMPAGSVNGMQTMANDAEGNVQFGAIDYTKPGDYRYTVSEVKGDAEGVTYDETEYAVTVHVTDDGEGSLRADLQYADGAEGIVFRNTYVKPQEPERPDNPDTPTPEEPSKPSTPTTPSAPGRPNTPSYSSVARPTYTTYVGSMASTGSSIAIIVAVSAALLIAGAGLLLMRKRERK